MGTKVVSLSNLAAELGAFTDAHMTNLRQATIAGIAATVPDIVESSPVDTGLYAQSWMFDETEFGAILANTAPHAAIIEFGARPFRPPLGPLLSWAKRVLKDSSQPPNYSPEVWRLAKGTQNKIAEHGMVPKKIMEKAIPGIIDNIKAEYRRGS